MQRVKSLSFAIGTSDFITLIKQFRAAWPESWEALTRNEVRDRIGRLLRVTASWRPRYKQRLREIQEGR
jgi:hypothetical protein